MTEIVCAVVRARGGLAELAVLRTVSGRCTSQGRRVGPGWFPTGEVIVLHLRSYWEGATAQIAQRITVLRDLGPVGGTGCTRGTGCPKKLIRASG